jgi:hypothetical protein
MPDPRKSKNTKKTVRFSILIKLGVLYSKNEYMNKTRKRGMIPKPELKT